MKIILWTVLAFLANETLNRMSEYSLPMAVFFYVVIGLLIIGAIREWRNGDY